jgi:hypothetical protein
MVMVVPNNNKTNMTTQQTTSITQEKHKDNDGGAQQ